MAGNDPSSAHSSAKTLAQLQRRHFDLQRWNATAVENPCLLLVECARDLVVLLARHHVRSSHGQLLYGVHMLTIPNGWRLHLLEVRASFAVTHLPDEWLYLEALVRNHGGRYRLFLDGNQRASSAAPFPVQPLTSSSYQTLASCTGRLLRAQLVATFGLSLPASVLTHRPWLLPGLPRLTLGRATSIPH